MATSPIAIWARALGSVHAAGGFIVTAHAAAPRPGGLLTESENATRRSPVRDPLGAGRRRSRSEGLLCLGYRSGALKILPLAGSAGATSVPRHCELGTGTNPGAQSGMVLLRAVDGGGQNPACHDGVLRVDDLWPLAELESAVRAAQPASSRSSQTPSQARQREHSNQGRPLSATQCLGLLPTMPGLRDRLRRQIRARFTNAERSRRRAARAWRPTLRRTRSEHRAIRSEIH